MLAELAMQVVKSCVKTHRALLNVHIYHTISCRLTRTSRAFAPIWKSVVYVEESGNRTSVVVDLGTVAVALGVLPVFAA